jgi:hypothetical protein
MAVPGNLGFETVGGADGMADLWAVRGKVTGCARLGFGPAVTVGPAVDPHAFNGAGWTKTGVTVAADASTDPDGNPTADQLTATAVVSYHTAEQPSTNLAAGGCYGIACYVRKVTNNYAALVWGAGTADESVAIFDLVNGRVASTSRSGSISKASASIFAVGSSVWFLVTLYVTTSAAITGIKPAVALSNGTALSYFGGNLRIAAWGAAVFDMPRESFEAFERAWSNDDFLVTLTIPASAYPSTFLTSFVDPVGFEAFESGWANFPYLLALATSAAATFDTTPETVEDFEDEWGATPFYTTIPGAVAATFDAGAEAFEDFEDAWLTSPWITTFVGTRADFDGDSFHPVGNPEDFEEVIRDHVFTVDVTANNLVSAGHGFANGTTVYVVQPDGGDLPSAFNPTIRYFVDNVTGNTFQLTTTFPGGTPPTLGDPGIGTQRVRGDPSRYWNELGYNPTI